jgi:cytochrome c biogenesis protein CcdA
VILVGFAFIAGIVTIASPCILPLLPIVLSGSAGQGRARPYAIVAGFVVVFSAATLTFSLLVQATGISTSALRWVAVAVLAGFGLVMLVPRLLVWFESLAARVATAGQAVGARASGGGTEAAGSGGAGAAAAPRAGSGLGGGLVVGASLGLVWTPCVGPIMASVITLAATGSVTGATVAITLAYALGTAIPMLLIILGGRALLTRLGGVKRAGVTIQRVFASLMIVVAGAIALNLDRQFQAVVLDAFPGLAEGITAVEENELVEEELDALRSTRSEQ